MEEKVEFQIQSLDEDAELNPLIGNADTMAANDIERELQNIEQYSFC